MSIVDTLHYGGAPVVIVDVEEGGARDPVGMTRG